MPIYMKLGDIKGDVTAEGHKGWIELDSMQFGVNRSIHMRTGRGGNRESSKPSFSEFVVTHSLDASDGPILDNAFHGQEGCEVQFDLVSTDVDDKNLYSTIKLFDVMISSFSCSSGGSSRPQIALSLNPLKIEYGVMKQEHIGSKSGAPDTVTYDIGEMKKV